MKSKPKASINQYLKLKKQSYQLGGSFKNPNVAEGITGAGSLGSSLIDAVDPIDEFGVQSTGGAIGSGALKGAATGAAFGPWGAAIGGVAGGISGFLKNKQAGEVRTEALQTRQELANMKAMQESKAVLANYDTAGTNTTQLKKGGTIYSWPGGYQVDPLKYKPTKYSFNKGGLKKTQPSVPAQGGNLKPIGESESFEVQGHAPGTTDDVKLGNAYVDHAEVVKPTQEGLRIFSDTIKPPGSKLPFSKLAKQLEKQKTNQEDRFPEQNKRIEKKLDSLFQTQQALNGNNNGESNEEALEPAGEERGEGFNQEQGEHNMFRTGGIKNIVSPTSRYYHKITPEAIGMNPGNYMGSMVMSGRNPQEILSENIYKSNINHDIKGRYKNGGNLYMNFKRPSYETPAEGIFEQPPGYHAELMKEPGHGKGAATFNNGGIHIASANKGKFNALKAATGKSTEELTHSNNPLTRKRAIFAQNAAKWNHNQMGGIVTNPGPKDYSFSVGNLATATDNSLVVDDQGNPIPATKQEVNRPLFVNPTAADPVFDNESAHNAYWKKKAISNLAGEDLAKYNNLLKTDPDNADTYIVMKGGTPIWQKPPTQTKPMARPANAPIGSDSSTSRLSKFDRTDPLHVYKKHGYKPKGFQTGGLDEDYFATYNRSKPEDASTVIPEKSGLKFNMADGLTTAATLAPVFANMSAARKLPQVAAPHLNRAVNLKNVNVADQLNALKQGLRVASLGAQQNSVNPNAQQAGLGNAQAQYMGAVNQAYGDVNRQNTQINNQESLYNSQIQGINNQKLDQYAAGQQARQTNALNLQSQNRADLSNKLLGMTASRNQQRLDQQKLAIQKGYLNLAGKGLYDRNLWLNGQESTNKKGGLIKRLNFKSSKKLA